MPYWNAEEQNTFTNIHDGMSVEDLVELLSGRTEAAVIRQAQKYDFGVKTVNGAKFFYENKKTRNRKKKSDTSVSIEVTRTIVGESKTARTVNEPTTSECLDNKSDDIVADNTVDITKTTILDVYEEINTLLYTKNYSLLHSVTVTLTGGSSISVTKVSL